MGFDGAGREIHFRDGVDVAADGERRGGHDGVAVDDLIRRRGRQINRRNAEIAQRVKFPGLHLRVAVGVDPDSQIGKAGIIGVDHAVTIGIERGEIGKSVAALGAQQGVGLARAL